MTETILLTGVTGFIAKHIALQLLDAGHHVRGTVRNLSRGEEVRAALAPELLDKTALDRLSFVEADLDDDAGWAAAATGATVLMHTASPFPIAQPKDADDLIRPAVEGTLRVLRAAKAAGIRRAIVTSSSVAILGTDLPAGRSLYDERDWTNTDSPGATAYSRSKTLAERAVWAFAEGEGRGMAITTINPGLVLGPPLDAHYGSSVGVIERMLKGRDPAVPKLGFVVVDVRDVAAMHCRAMDSDAANGQRIITVSDSVWMGDLARALKTAFPERRIATMTAPKMLLRILALFDGQVRAVLPAIGRIEHMDNSKGVALLGRPFIPWQDALLASARFLLDNKRV